MNDVTILAPLPQASAAPVLLAGADLADDGTSLVPHALVDRLVQDSDLGTPILGPDTLERLQLIAVRFDLCDRHVPGVCPEAEDARLRLVFQPVSDGPAGPATRDVGFHAFYAIRKDEAAEAVAALLELAMTGASSAGPLRVSPALSVANPEAYAAKLRAFVRRYGGESRLVRLTVNAQPEVFAQVRWELRGLERRADSFVDIAPVGTTETSESVFLASGTSYDVTPSMGLPAELLAVISKSTFDAADLAKQREYLAALAAFDNPLTHTAETVACVACHVSTVVTSARAASAGVDPLSIPGRYTSKVDLSTAGGESAQTPNTLRALGYLGQRPMISQRVVNETAQTLAEIEARYFQEAK